MYLGTGVAAKKYGLTNYVVRKLADTGIVQSIRTAGGHLQVLEASLQEYLGISK